MYNRCRNTMNEELLEFWEQVDRKIYDIIQLIRCKHTRFNGTPVEKVINHLYDGFKAAYDVEDAIHIHKLMLGNSFWLKNSGWH